MWMRAKRQLVTCVKFCKIEQYNGINVSDFVCCSVAINVSGTDQS